MAALPSVWRGKCPLNKDCSVRATPTAQYAGTSEVIDPVKEPRGASIWCAPAASWPRLSTPSLAKARFRWLFTVGTRNEQPLRYLGVGHSAGRQGRPPAALTAGGSPIPSGTAVAAPASSGISDSFFEAERPAFGQGCLEKQRAQGLPAGPPVRVPVPREPGPAARSR